MSKDNLADAKRAVTPPAKHLKPLMRRCKSYNHSRRQTSIPECSDSTDGVHGGEREIGLVAVETLNHQLLHRLHEIRAHSACACDLIMRSAELKLDLSTGERFRNPTDSHINYNARCKL